MMMMIIIISITMVITKVMMMMIIRMVTNDSKIYPRCQQQILLTATSMTCHPFFNTNLHLNNFDRDDCLMMMMKFMTLHQHNFVASIVIDNFA